MQINQNFSFLDCTLYSGFKCTLYDGMSPLIPPPPTQKKKKTIKKIVHYIPDSVVQYVPDSVVHYIPKYSVIHYRPASNKIIHLIYGPFLFQHDVDIISDYEIAVFNNNTTTIGNFDDDEVNTDNEDLDEILYSEILIYNYKDSTFRKRYKNSFKEENIYTRTEGLYEFLPSGNLYVENHNDGELYIFNENEEVLLKKQFATPLENMVHMPTWVRIYKDIEF